MSILAELEPLFYPRGVAIIGASQDPRKFGHLCVRSLLNSEFEGPVYPINPSVSHLVGLKTYPSLGAAPGLIDLCIIVLSPDRVLSALEECGNRGIKGAIIITAGFRESGAETGSRLQREMTRIADRFGIKIIGPNTFGMVNLHAGLNASFTPLFSSLKKGPVAFISQSGGMCHNFSYMAMDDGLGISKIMSLGNRCNLEFSDMIRYLGEDPQTEVIAMYVEGVEDGRALLSVAREVARKKPLIAYKGARSQASGTAAFSHTGSLAGNYPLYQSAFRQARVITVTDSTSLFDGAKALSLCPRPSGNRIAICSIIAGPAIVASDASEGEGLVLPRFSPETQERLDRVLSPLFMNTNPVDLTSAQSMEIWSEVFHAVFSDGNTDLLLVILPKQEFYDPMIGGIVDLLIELSSVYRKPLSVCATSPVNMFAGYKARLQDNRIPVYPTPERAARAMGYLVRYALWQSDNSSV
ncbi:MAG: CoA-binding protein [Pseudomonadota bacterium]